MPQGKFCGVSNIDLNLIACNNKIVITSILKSYVLHWYHIYLLHTGMDITKAMICQHLYCPGIRNAVHTEVTNCDTCQRTKRSNIKYGKLPAKLVEEIPWNKLCVPSVIRMKHKKENLHLKYITMNDPVT